NTCGPRADTSTAGRQGETLPDSLSLESRSDPADLRDDSIWIDGFLNVSVASGSEKICFMPCHGIGRHGNDWNTLANVRSSDHLQHLCALDVRQLNIKNDKIGPVFQGHLKTLLAAERLKGLVAKLLQESGNQHHIVDVVLDDESRFHGCAP